MGYEGEFPVVLKKLPSTRKNLLPPFWRFLAHTFMNCISGSKGGSDEIPSSSITAIVSLVLDWQFNFSRYVLSEMISNINIKKKALFLDVPALSANYPKSSQSNPSTLRRYT